MKKVIIGILLCSFAFAGSGDGERAFEAAKEAVAAEDYSKSLDHFEAALLAEPDNLRYGSEYRQAVIEVKAYDRCIDFFEKLVTENPDAGNAFLNYGFAYVDKIPDSGSITQVINANTALSYFSKSIELAPTWLGYYTRGNSYLFWPVIFNRTQLGVDDLEEALKIQKGFEKIEPYHVRSYIALGDAHWKLDKFDEATQVWRQGLAEFPENEELQKRLELNGDELAALIQSRYDPNVRVETDLQEVWGDQ